MTNEIAMTCGEGSYVWQENDEAKPVTSKNSEAHADTTVYMLVCPRHRSTAIGELSVEPGTPSCIWTPVVETTLGGYFAI